MEEIKNRLVTVEDVVNKKIQVITKHLSAVEEEKEKLVKQLNELEKADELRRFHSACAYASASSKQVLIFVSQEIPVKQYPHLKFTGMYASFPARTVAEISRDIDEKEWYWETTSDTYRLYESFTGKELSLKNIDTTEFDKYLLTKAPHKERWDYDDIANPTVEYRNSEEGERGYGRLFIDGELISPRFN